MKRNTQLLSRQQMGERSWKKKAKKERNTSDAQNATVAAKKPKEI